MGIDERLRDGSGSMHYLGPAGHVWTFINPYAVLHHHRFFRSCVIHDGVPALIYLEWTYTYIYIGLITATDVLTTRPLRYEHFMIPGHFIAIRLRRHHVVRRESRSIRARITCCEYCVNVVRKGDENFHLEVH